MNDLSPTKTKVFKIHEWRLRDALTLVKIVSQGKRKGFPGGTAVGKRAAHPKGRRSQEGGRHEGLGRRRQALKGRGRKLADGHRGTADMFQLDLRHFSAKGGRQ